MLKLLGTLVKAAIFAAVILVLGNWIRWDGKTLSDQVRSGMAHAERTEIAGKLKRMNPSGGAARPNPKAGDGKMGTPELKAEAETEEFAPSERQKLRALIRELGGATP